MAFGKRASGHSRAPSDAPRAAKPGRWWVAYPLAVLAVAVVGYLTMIAMALVPAFNPRGSTIAEIAVPAGIAALNIAVVAAITMPLVDVVLGLSRYRRRWLYCGAVGCLDYVFCLWVGSLGGVAPSPVLYIGMVLIPAGAGGWVLGHFREGKTGGR